MCFHLLFQAYIQLCKKPSLLQKFDADLKEVAQSQNFSIGQEINSYFLGHSEGYLARVCIYCMLPTWHGAFVCVYTAGYSMYVSTMESLGCSL